MEYKKIVYIEWEDIISTDDSWRTPDEALDWSASETSIVSQVGFLLDKDENFVTICSSYLSTEMIGMTIRIPVSTIKYIKELTINEFKT